MCGNIAEHVLIFFFGFKSGCWVQLRQGAVLHVGEERPGQGAVCWRTHGQDAGETSSRTLLKFRHHYKFVSWTKHWRRFPWCEFIGFACVVDVCFTRRRFHGFGRDGVAHRGAEERMGNVPAVRLVLLFLLLSSVTFLVLLARKTEVTDRKENATINNNRQGDNGEP